MSRLTKSPSFSGLSSLIQGYQKFKAQHFEKKKSYQALVRYGQRPKVLMIACCDSRVDPALIMQCHPGELFVVRNVANLVPPFDQNPRHHSTSAALEFAVKRLEVTDIIVFGHSHCGGIRALMENSRDTMNSDFMSAWMDIAQLAKQEVLTQYPEASIDEKSYHCEKKSLVISKENLLTFPWIKERVLTQKLFLHAWYFDLKTGTIETYQNHPDSQFIPLESILFE